MINLWGIYCHICLDWVFSLRIYSNIFFEPREKGR